MFQITISTTLGDSVQKLEGGFWGSSNVFFDFILAPQECSFYIKKKKKELNCIVKIWIPHCIHVFST